MDRMIRELQEQLVDVLNNSSVPYEGKRIILENLMIKCEIEANKNIFPVTEKGELEDEPKLD